MKNKLLYKLLCTTMIASAATFAAEQQDASEIISGTPLRNPTHSRVANQGIEGTPITLEAEKKKKAIKADLPDTPTLTDQQRKLYEPTALDPATKVLFVSAGTQLAKEQRDEGAKKQIKEIEAVASQQRVERAQREKEKQYASEEAEYKIALERLTETTLQIETLEIKIKELSYQLEQATEEKQTVNKDIELIRTELEKARQSQPMAANLIQKLQESLANKDSELKIANENERKVKESLQIVTFERDKEKKAKELLARGLGVATSNEHVTLPVETALSPVDVVSSPQLQATVADSAPPSENKGKVRAKANFASGTTSDAIKK